MQRVTILGVTDLRPVRGPMSEEAKQRLSEAMRASPRVKEARAKQRGIPRGPLSDETRARMSASKRYTPGTDAWDRAYTYYLMKLHQERQVFQVTA